MRTILIVKTSSLGDVVHCLPAVTDIARHLPGVVIDWVVEEGYAAVPAMHPAVRHTIVCAVRRWRRTPFARATRDELRAFGGQIGRERYDAIVDAQGLLKSAVIARYAHGRRFGLDWASSREPLAPLYDRVFRIPRSLHAVERNRQLCAAALGYCFDGPPDYGIRAAPARQTWLPDGPYLVFLHATSADAKLWPEDRWVALGVACGRAGLAAVLPWGSESERERAGRLAGAIPDARVVPRLPVADLAGLLAGARAVVGVDTGLTHLAAALGMPVVGLYCATAPGTTGVCAAGRAVNLGDVGVVPEVAAVRAALAGFGVPA
jgi:heptosyltransferase-1